MPISSAHAMKTQSPSMRLSLLLILATGTVASSCELPDLKPFAEATARLDSAARQTRDSLVEQLTGLASQIESQVPSAKAEADSLRKAAQDLSDEWRVRIQATEALLAYSESLANIASAGESGAEGARALGESVNELLGSIPSVTAQIPAAALNLTAWIGGIVSEVRAHESLSKSVAAAHPTITLVAPLIAADFQVVARNLEGTQILGETLLNKQYGDLLTYRTHLLERQLAVANRIKSLATGTAIPKTDSDEATMVAHLLRDADSWHSPYSNKLEALHTRVRLHSQLATEAQETVLQWAKLHGELAEVLASQRAPSVATLLNHAKQLEGLIKKLQEET